MLPTTEEVRIKYYVNEMRFYVESMRDEAKKDKDNRFLVDHLDTTVLLFDTYVWYYFERLDKPNHFVTYIKPEFYYDEGKIVYTAPEYSIDNKTVSAYDSMLVLFPMEGEPKILGVRGLFEKMTQEQRESIFR